MTRELCKRCKRPLPQTCICQALPTEQIKLSRTRVIVLQHPHEQKRKNRSLPLIELCLQGQHQPSKENVKHPFYQDFSLHTCIGKWWGQEVVNASVWNIVHNPHEPLFIIFPADGALSLEEAILRTRTPRNTENTNSVYKEQEKSLFDYEENRRDGDKKKINLLFIDATWKYAKEMNAKTIQKGGWPPHSIYVRLDPMKDFGEDLIPLRFDIRTPPSPNHLSTGECIAHMLRIMEESDQLFDALMRPLDLMVQQWHALEDIQKKKKQANNQSD